MVRRSYSPDEGTMAREMAPQPSSPHSRPPCQQHPHPREALGSFMLSLLYKWPDRYPNRQPISKVCENTPRIMRGLAPGEILKPEDLLQFVHTDLNSASDKHRIDTIRDILGEATVERLLSDDGSLELKPVALLIDGNISNGRPELRPWLGGLTAKQLYGVLSKDRYQTPSSKYASLDAERRLIYVTNLDCWGIIALVCTASELFYRALGDFILSYIRASASISVAFAPEGPETFSLEFSFPFYVWRSTKKLSTDSRIKRSDGEPLRSSKDVTPLTGLMTAELDSNTVNGIYESQISCVVTGYDQWRWTALLVADNWFDEQLGDMEFAMPDALERFEADIECGLQTDPLSRGQDDVKKSRWFPRAYFLRIMGIRLVQIKQEWEELHYHLEKIFERYVEHHKTVFRQMQVCMEGHQRVGVRDDNINDLSAKIATINGILKETTRVLQETIRSVSLFLESDIYYFFSNQEMSLEDIDCQSQLPHVRRVFQQLRRMHDKFSDMEHASKEMLRDIEISRGNTGY